MADREKKLIAMFAIAAVVAGGWVVVRPALRRYVFDVSEANQRLLSEVGLLQDQLQAVSVHQDVYRDYLARTGTTDVSVVRDRAHARLLKMTVMSRLHGVTVTPKKSTAYVPHGERRRSDVNRVAFAVRGDGSLENAIGFLKSFYELPYIGQMTDVSITPQQKSSTVSLSTTIEILVPPSDPLHEIDATRLVSHESFIQHAGNSYASIWQRKPFNEYVAPVMPNSRSNKGHSATGELAQVGNDSSLKTGRKANVPEPPRPSSKTVRMTLLYGYDEVMIVDTKSGMTEYVGIGSELDGGEVVMVHALGAVTKRDREHRFYPLGMKLDQSMPMSVVAERFPEVIHALAKHRGESSEQGTLHENSRRVIEPLKARYGRRLGMGA